MPKKTAVSAGPALLENLMTLGKMQRGDMITVAGANGRFVRKTNWLTQHHNKDKTHNSKLFDQIDEVLASAEELAANDNEANQQVEELRSLYMKAVRGLDTLLQTYRSKGSKETDLIDRLTVVLVDHAKNIEESTKSAVEDIDGLKKTAERAIKYVNDCRIRSVNNTFGHGGWFGNPYFDRNVDAYLFMLLVRGFSGNRFPGGIQTVGRELKTFVADVIRRPISRKEKRLVLAAKLQEWFGEGEPGGHLLTLCQHNMKQTDGEKKFKTLVDGFEERFGALSDDAHAPWRERQRHKLARRAMRTRFGNCVDKAAVVATHIVESTKGQIGICRVGGVTYDHEWVLISRNRDELFEGCQQLHSGRATRRERLPRDTVVADGWTDRLNGGCHRHPSELRRPPRAFVFFAQDHCKACCG
jgi:hypothetical protein